MKWSIPERIIELGRSYMQEGRVTSVVQGKNEKIWYAEVLGKERYLVQLDGTAKEEDRCECPYWREHGYCKHTVAVELYLRKKGISRIIKTNQTETVDQSEYSLSEMFTKGFAKLNVAEQKPEIDLVHVEFCLDVLETNNYYPELSVLVLSLKIGIQAQKPKMYIVKNIGDFFQAYQKESKFLINKKYQIDLSKRIFLEEDNEIIEQLFAIYQTSQLLGANGVQVKGKLDKRYLILPIDQGKVLLTKMSNTKHFYLNDGQHKYQQVHFVNKKLPLHFGLDKLADFSQYHLTIDNPFTLFLSHYSWGFIKNNIYIFDKEQEKIYLTLIQLLKRVEQPKIIYKKEELSDLFSLVVPLLKKIGTFDVSSNVEQVIVYDSLKPLFVFRKIKEKIKLRVDFMYGEVIFSSDESYTTNLSDHKEIIRDIKQEQEITKVIEKFNYQKISTGFEKELPKNERLYYFFKAEIPTFRKLGEVMMGKKLRDLFLDAQQYQPTIEVSDSDSWLDVRFDISGIAEQEIDAVLASLLKKEPFYTLETGEILSFDSEEFYQTSEILLQLRKNMNKVNKMIQLPRHQGVVVEKLLENNSTAHFSDSFKEMVNHLTAPENFNVDLPKGLNATLRKYQIDGYKWLKMLSYYQFGGILADEMGLGKTIQTIAYLLSEKEEACQKGQALIVAPASLTYNWAAELQKFSPDLQVVVSVGNKQERKKILEQSTADVIITSYASLRQDIEIYQTLALGYLILDEAQMVKNNSTKTAQALKSLTIPQRFALSGTPIENNIEELWSIFQMILPGLLPKKSIFKEMAVEEIAKIIQPFILRRDKKNVLADLPEKIETNVYSVLTEEQKTIYLAYLRQMQEDVGKMDQAMFKKNRLSILAGLTRLRQICCDPQLFIEDYKGGSGKLEQVKELLLTAKENQRRVLLFSQFTSMLSILEKELDQLGLTTFYLRGSTKPKERLEMADAFNSGEKDVFLISLKAGGTGLNLTGADTVILYDLWWNPAVEEQAAGRAHRMGQKNVVEIWRMIAEGTIEEKMNLLQKEKRDLFQKVILGNEEQLVKLTEEDIRTILSIGE